jgi:hypothetical protein
MVKGSSCGSRCRCCCLATVEGSTHPAPTLQEGGTAFSNVQERRGFRDLSATSRPEMVPSIGDILVMVSTHTED